MTMVVDNNFKKYDNAALVLLPFQYFIMGKKRFSDL